MDNSDDFELHTSDEFFSVVKKGSVNSLQQKDLIPFFKKYPLAKLILTCRKIGTSSVFIKLQDIDKSKAFEELDAARSQARKTRLILTNYNIAFIKEMPTILHARVTRYVEKQIFLSILHHITLDENGETRTDDLELAGDGCKWPYMRHLSQLYRSYVPTI